MIFRILLIFVTLCYVTPASSKVVERIIAIVNDDIITQTDVSKYREQLSKDQFVDEILVTDPTALLEDPQKLIDHLINERLIDTEVKRLGMTVPAEKVEQEIQRIAQRNRITRDQLLEVLKRQGATFKDYHKFLKTKLERQAFVERFIMPYIQISNDDIVHYYYSRQRNGKAKESTPTYEYKIAYTLFRWDTAKGEENIQAAQSRAEHAHSLLASGDDFDKVIAEQSKSSSLTSGGLLGTFNSEELLDEFEVGIKGLKTGQFSQVIRGPNGFYILKLLAKKLIEDPDLAHQTPEIQRTLYQEALQNRLNIWLSEKRHQAFIKINPYNKDELG